MQAQYIVSQHHEQFSLLVAGKIAELDYPVFVKTTVNEDARTKYGIGKFVSSNQMGYYILLNTWTNLAFDIGGKAIGQALKGALRHHGVYAVSTHLKKVSDMLVRAAHEAEHLWDETSSVAIDDSALPDCSKIIRELVRRLTKLPFVKARQICVWPKRFAPIVPRQFSTLYDVAINAFLAVNQQNCRYEYRINSIAPLVHPRPDDARCLPFRLTSVDDTALEVAKLARRISCLILGEYQGLSVVRDKQLPRFGPGACANAGKGILERYECCIQYGYYTPSIMPTMGRMTGVVRVRHPDTRTTRCVRGRIVNSEPMCSRGFWGTSRYPQVSRPTSVPKTQWTDRLIALEDVCNLSDQLHLKDAMAARFAATVREAIPVTDQDQNREMARFAAYSNRYATLDLSHASDSNTKPLVQMLVPSSWWDYGFRGCIPFGFQLPEDRQTTRVRALHMFGTMGCGCTFNVEALTFFALVTACDMIHSGCPTDSLDLPSLQAYLEDVWIRVMGDDIICRSECAEFTITVLAYFGFEVNVEKSFMDGRFRESCGADWLLTDKPEGDGVIDVTCVYYPRIPIGRDFVASMARKNRSWSEEEQEGYYESGLQRMIAMQQRLLDVAPTASAFVRDLLRKHFPDLSTSFPGENAQTLWAYDAVAEYAYNVTDLVDRSWVEEHEENVLGISDVHSEYTFSVYTDFWTCFHLLNNQPVMVDSTHRRSELSDLRRQMSWRRRETYRVPRLVADSSTRVRSWAAEILLYELSLTRNATADSILNVLVLTNNQKIAEQMATHSPLSCVRPARLRRAQLVDASTLTITLTQ